MTGIGVQRRRTGWDVVLGIVLIVAGFVVLGDVVVATVVSVLFIGWTALIAGGVVLVGTAMRINRGASWVAALGGALLLALGLMLIRRPDVGALTLTLLAGGLFLVGGITRIVAAVGSDTDRALLMVSGIISTILGLIVFFNIWAASLTLLGVLLGIEALTEGITLLLVGRVHTDSRPVGRTTAAA